MKHPRELIRNYIKFCESSFTELVTEMHMTEFCPSDQQALIRLGRILEQNSLDLLSLSIHKVNNDKILTKQLIREIEIYKKTIYQKVVSGRADDEFIKNLSQANELINKTKEPDDTCTQ